MAAKEKMMFCETCKKETKHVISVFSSPVGWNCTEDHPGDDTCCHKCGAPFVDHDNETYNKVAEVMVQVFGLKKPKRYCKNCTGRR